MSAPDISTRRKRSIEEKPVIIYLHTVSINISYRVNISLVESAQALSLTQSVTGILSKKRNHFGPVMPMTELMSFQAHKMK